MFPNGSGLGVNDALGSVSPALPSNMDVDMLDMSSMVSPTPAMIPSLPRQQPPTSAPVSAIDSKDSLTVTPTTGGTQIGAGPLPTNFGIPPPPGTGSTLTEFTKRRNWSKLILHELRDLFIVLSNEGRILHVSVSCKEITGYEPQEFVSRFIIDFVHQEDRGMFTKEFNESIASGQPIRFFYRMRRQDESYAILEASGHPHFSSDFPFGAARNCRGVFLMSRPYPTKTAGLLDSFLEHKIENERLARRIQELKREEQEEQSAQDQYWSNKDGQGSVTPSETQRTDGRTDTENGTSTYDGMPPPPKPSISNTALTKQNLNEALAGARQDSLNDKMARYEGASHIDTIEMLTGLQYREGERAKGISTGAASPALIHGDAGIAILTDRDSRTQADKKKKLKVADEYVCTDCGTLDSPEWRKGPAGPKTLCNACGLRWAKKEKKRQGGSDSVPIGMAAG